METEHPTVVQTSVQGGEAFCFTESGKKDDPISLAEVLDQFPEYNRIRQSHFVYCKGCQRFLGCRLQITQEPFNDFNGPVPQVPGLDFLLLCAPYLIELDRQGLTEINSQIVHCSGRIQTNGVTEVCGAKLFRCDAVLSRQHAWRKPGCRIEPAWYINNFWNQETVNVGHPSCSNLAQGLMETANVWCSKCETIVGWKFVKDLCSKKPNVHFVHRFGVCESSMIELMDTSDTMEGTDDERNEGNEEFDEEHEESESLQSTEDDNFIPHTLDYLTVLPGVDSQMQDLNA